MFVSTSDSNQNQTYLFFEQQQFSISFPIIIDNIINTDVGKVGSWSVTYGWFTPSLYQVYLSRELKCKLMVGYSLPLSSLFK